MVGLIDWLGGQREPPSVVALADNAYPQGGWVSYGTPEQTYAQWQSMGHYATQMRKAADDFYTAMAWPWFEEEKGS